MDGSDHYRKAEELAAKAEKYLGQEDGQGTAAVWAAGAQDHATLALAAAAGVGSGSQPAAGNSQENTTAAETLHYSPPPWVVQRHDGNFPEFPRVFMSLREPGTGPR
jgi:hypothetical protein